MRRTRLLFSNSKSSLIGIHEHGLVQNNSLPMVRRLQSSSTRRPSPNEQSMPPSNHPGFTPQTYTIQLSSSYRPPAKHPPTTQIHVPMLIPTSETNSFGTTDVLPTIQTKIAFISGPLEPDATYFRIYYLPLIDQAISEGHHFVLAASKGIDAEARAYLLSRVPASRLTIYLQEREGPLVRTSLKAFERAGGRVVITGRNHTARDEALTRASHYDILRYRTDDECRLLYGKAYRRRISGTEKNELRRKAGMGLIQAEPEVFQDIRCRKEKL